MPSEMADALSQNSSHSHPKHYRYNCYSKICAALAAAFCITAIGSTSYASYNVYQEKQLAIFMDYNLTQQEKAARGDELAASFEENPLKDSDNFQVSVQMGADTQAAREKSAGLTVSGR